MHWAKVKVKDKAKVDFGKPGSAISSGLRGEKSIVPVGSVFWHPWSRRESERFIIPISVIRSWLSGRILTHFVKIKLCSHNKNDAMFEGSLLFKHAAKVKNRILWMWDGNPILMLFSDGGSDHRLTYEHVDLSLIALFKELHLDLLIAACTAPGHGWANSMERTIKVFLRKMKNRGTLFLNPFDYHSCEIYISSLLLWGH